MGSYTRLRVTPRGVVLGAWHLRRCQPLSGRGPTALAEFYAHAAPGVWRLWVDAAGLRSARVPDEPLSNTPLVRMCRSPLGAAEGLIPKPASPSPYDALRRPDRLTLLVSSDGEEIFEACSGAVLGWDGRAFVCPPPDRPRVWSTSEWAIRAHLPVREAPLRCADTALPLLFVNAVRGAIGLALPHRPPCPAAPLHEIHALFTQLTIRRLP